MTKGILKKSPLIHFKNKICYLICILISFICICSIYCINSSKNTNLFNSIKIKATNLSDIVDKNQLFETSTAGRSISFFNSLHQKLSHWLRFRRFSVFDTDPIFLEETSRQNEFFFDNLKFSSKFESGSLFNVRKIKNDKFDIFVSSDKVINQSGEEKRNWFYFKLSHVKIQKSIKLSIKNLIYNWSMWKHGLVPVIKSNIRKGYKNWKLFDLGESKLIIKSGKLQLDFEYPLLKNEEVEIALTFPYTFTQNNNYFKRLENNLKKMLPKMSIQKETLIYSNLKNPVDLIWIGTQKNLSKKILPPLKNLFPDRNNGEPAINLMKGKCNVVISARVHPSETAANYMLEGFLNHMLNQEKIINESKKSFLNIIKDFFQGHHTEYKSSLFENNNHANFKLDKLQHEFFKKCNLIIIPMLNPDGVINGLTRTDINGINLNNYYEEADLHTPSIYALKKFIKWIHQSQGISYFFDLHSHFTKRGAFLFGNPLRKKSFKKVLMFPFLFDKNEKEFSIKGSSFGSKKKESTSRKEISKISKINKVYTIEVNYWGQKETLKKLKKKQLMKYNYRVVKNGKNFYKRKDFRRIGKNMAKSLLQAINLNKNKEKKSLINKKLEKINQKINMNLGKKKKKNIKKTKKKKNKKLKKKKFLKKKPKKTKTKIITKKKTKIPDLKIEVKDIFNDEEDDEDDECKNGNKLSDCLDIINYSKDNSTIQQENNIPSQINLKKLIETPINENSSLNNSHSNLNSFFTKTNDLKNSNSKNKTENKLIPINPRNSSNNSSEIKTDSPQNKKFSLERNFPILNN